LLGHSLFFTNDAFSVVVLQTSEHTVVCLLVLLELALFIIELEGDKLHLLVENCLFFVPALLGHFECLLSFLERSFKISESLVIQGLLILSSVLEGVAVRIVLLLKHFEFLGDFMLLVLGIPEVLAQLFVLNLEVTLEVLHLELKLSVLILLLV
jgi:hypothetical protein